MKKIRSLLIALLLGSSMAWAVDTETPVNRIVAIVNNGVITAGDLDTTVAIESFEAASAGISLPDHHSLEMQALQELITQTAALQLAERNHIAVTDQDVDSALKTMLEAGHTTLAQLNQHLTAAGISEAEYRNFLKQQLIIRKLEQAAIASSIMVTPDEITRYLDQQQKLNAPNVEYTVSHILISLPANPTPEDIQKASAKAQKVHDEIVKGLSFEQAAMQYSDSDDATKGGVLQSLPLLGLPDIFIAPVKSLKPGEISEPFKSATGFHIVKLDSVKSADMPTHTITQYHLAQILIQTSPIVSPEKAKHLLTHLLTALKNGEDFATLARQNSEDSVTAGSGGDLGWVSVQQLSGPYAHVVSSLADNAVSQPFETDKGWVIVKMLGKRQHNDTENYLREQAANAIFQKKAMEMVNSWKAQIRGESFVKILVPYLNPEDHSFGSSDAA